MSTADTPLGCRHTHPSHTLYLLLCVCALALAIAAIWLGVSDGFPFLARVDMTRSHTRSRSCFGWI